MRDFIELTTVTLAALVMGCGGMGTAEFKLMDAPPAGVSSVKICVASVQAHVVDKDKDAKGDPADASIDDGSVAASGSDDAQEPNKWISFGLSGENGAPCKTIDLVQAQGETAAAKLGELELPEGKITQVRLVIDTSQPANNTVTVDGTVCNLDVAKVAQKGVKINHVFKAWDVDADDKQEVVLDFDLGESLKVKGTCGTGSGYELEPKLKLHKVKKNGAEISVSP